jgi:thiol-disulfide isomerase/thioredoxin
MRRLAQLVVFGSLAALSFGLVGCSGEVTSPSPEQAWEDAVAAAGRDGVVLVDFYADWCGPCKRFDAALDEDPTLLTSLERVSFVQIDAEKGYGETLAETYGVSGFPTFVLTDADGALLDRWSGWEDAEGFIATLDEALVAPMPLEARIARFEAEPTADDAVRLARMAETADDSAEAVRYYREAVGIDPSRSTEVLPSLTYASIGGLRSEATTIEEVRETARAMFADEGIELADKVEIALMLSRAGSRHDAPDLAVEFLTAAMPAAEASDDERVVSMRADLGIAHALTVLDDPQAALEFKRASMEDGWSDDPAQLNGFAWWCFEHEVNVEEALELARKGADLAEPGSERAMILDTVAELCNLAGDCGEAIATIDLAIEQDPDRAYYKEQRARFEAILAEAGSGSATES